MPDHYRLDTKILDQIIGSLPSEVDRLGRATSEGITSDIKLSMNTSPPGRSYRRGSITHIASQPGYPPNVDTGALRASMHWFSEGPGRFVVSDGVEYGYYLEEGTDTMQPRPFVQPVFTNWRNSKFVRLAQTFGLVKT